MQSSGDANGPKRRTDWDAVDWRKANRIVTNLRQRIFRATRTNRNVLSKRATAAAVTQVAA
jgi:hypothetical protein